MFVYRVGKEKEYVKGGSTEYSLHYNDYIIY